MLICLYLAAADIGEDKERVVISSGSQNVSHAARDAYCFSGHLGFREATALSCGLVDSRAGGQAGRSRFWSWLSSVAR